MNVMDYIREGKVDSRGYKDEMLVVKLECEEVNRREGTFEQNA